MRKSKSLFVCALALLLSTSPVVLGSGHVDPGDDYWVCPDAKIVFGGGGGGGGVLPPIAADFFEPGSEPFEGQVACVGHVGDPDTTIERQTTGNTSGTPPVNDTIDIEIIALNLVSTAPITVTGGGGPQLWDVRVDLSPSGSGGTGQMELTTLDQTPDSGYFLIDPLPISFRFTFTRVSDGEERTLDMGLDGIADIDYSSMAPYPWEESPIGNDFNPTGEFPMALSAGDTGYILLMPYLLRQDWFEGTMNESGYFAGGGSSGFGDGTGIGNGVDPGEWYEYPNNSPSWWNTWFYDHPFDDEREKTVDLSFFIMPYNPGFPGGSFVEIALNWSKPPWDPCQPAPPLPGDVPNPTIEDTYIGRYLVFIESYPGGIPPGGFPIPLPPTVLPVTYNPEWISIDIRGWNYVISAPIFGHVCVSQVQEALGMDFGDAPDPPYPTWLNSNGARHVIIQGFYLGASVDAEPDGQPNGTATGDDILDGSDDEDGVTFTSSLIPGQIATVDVIASAPGLLDAWINFNADGSWAQPGDQIFIAFPLAPGLNSLTFTVPPTATLGLTTVSRFRFSSVGNLGYDGQAPDGEVEDHQVDIDYSLDFGDAPDPTYPTLIANSGASHKLDGLTYLGDDVDLEADGQPDPCALGDDNDGNDDEDGVAFTSLIIPGDPCATLDVVASVAGKLNAWLDFNDDGDWADPCEQIFTDTNLAAGTNNLSFGVPGSASVDLTFARFRFDTAGGLSYTGQANDGEVEDYMVEIDSQQVCEPLWDGSACKPATCGQQDDECQPVSANFDPVTGDTTVTDCDCRAPDQCHVQFSHGVDWPCAEPNNGSGTIDLPPDCDYTGTEPFMIIDGLPPETTIEMDGILMDFINIVTAGGGKLGGEVQHFDATLDLTVRGTGSLAGFNRHLAVPIECEVHTAPPDAWEPLQIFITDMNSLTGELFGDPDFCTFRIKAGTGNGLSSPGQTTLVELPSGDFAVDSFFDITYEIEFEGCLGSQLDGYSGTTTDTTRIETGSLPHPACAGDCPAGWACRETTIDNPDGTIDISCECVELQCEPTPDSSSCQPAACPEQGDQCQPMCVNFDPVTADTTVLDCDCLDPNNCHMYIPSAPDNPCTVSDNGSGTITLPPIGCQYECIPNQEQWMIVDGLPPDTTIELGGILYDFICDGNPTQNCSMPLAQQECETSGGSLGGEGHCFEATLRFDVKGTGSLAGFSRTLAVPIEGELHTAPRNPGDPVQMFSVNIVRLSGELFGDPDFCEFIVTAGTDSDLPSWGRTILTDLGDGTFAVDSFFDITYQVEFEGCTGSQLDSYSGTTTATVRMQTGDMPSCIGDCEPGMVCEDIIILNPNGSIDISCECEEEVCEPAWDDLHCDPIGCPEEGKQCQPACVNFDPVTGDTTVTDCDCRAPDQCHVQFSNVDWPCAEPNNGSGTIDLPPDCDYTGTEPFMIIDGLPPGTTIEMDGILMDFVNIVTAPGGKLGGEVEYFDSTLDLTVRGTGSLAGFNRHLAVPVECEVHTAPPDAWEPLQVFIMDMNSLTGELFGDPDFCTFRVKAGTGNGLPSPGQTTLMELPDGDFVVDSFFDITYEIEFEGCPASQLEDYSGTTTATTRIETGTLPHPACAGDCPPGTICNRTIIVNPDGTIDICCDRIPGETPQCIVPDNGTGTIDLPPEDCEYAGPDPADLWMIVDGFPPGDTIEMEGILMDWVSVVRSSGGTLSGEIQEFDATLDLDVSGTGGLNGFNRHLAVPMVCEVHTAPRTPGDPVQTFATDMYDMTGELFGDPDFCTFRITAGTGNGLPSPGETALVQLPSGDFAVDSFFDITYQIEFEGCPGTQLDGYSGTTEETVHMSTCQQYSFDFDYSSIIDFHDFYTFAVRWLNEDIACCLADHDTDGDVDLDDLAHHGLVWLASSP